MVEIQYEWTERSQSTAGAGEFAKRQKKLHKQQSYPNHGYLDLDQSNHASFQRFSDFANKTLKRYESSNKKIHTFSLRMDDQRCYEYPLLRDTATSLIVRSLKLGATRLWVQMIRSLSYVLPDEVFESETLVALSSKGCDLNPDQLIRCSNLESLSLDTFWIRDSYVITRILSSCPLIRILSLSHVSTRDSCRYDSYSDNDDDGYGNYDYEYYDARIRPHGLTSMELKYVDFDTLFLSDLSTRFPSLKELTLHTFTEGDTLLISSPTVERLTFVLQQTSSWHRVVRFDFPSIRKFTYEGSVISTPSQFMYDLNNLKEARAEIFDEALSVWRDVALDALLNDSTTRTLGDVNRKVRLQLNLHQSSTFRDNTAATNADTRARVHDEYMTPNYEVGFEDGDFVWVVLTKKQYPDRTYFRDSYRRVGPFEIVEKMYSNAYRLRVPTHVGAPDVINVKHLVPYSTGDHYSPSDEDEDEAPDVNDVQLFAWEFIEKQERSNHVMKRHCYRKPRRRR